MLFPEKDFRTEVAEGDLVRFGRGTGFAYGRVRAVTKRSVKIKLIVSGSGIHYGSGQPVTTIGATSGKGVVKVASAGEDKTVVVGKSARPFRIWAARGMA